MVPGYANLNWVTPKDEPLSETSERKTPTSATNPPKNRFFCCLSSDFWNLPLRRRLVSRLPGFSAQPRFLSVGFAVAHVLLTILFARTQTGFSYVSKPFYPCRRKMKVPLKL